MVPWAEPPPEGPETLQVTAVLEAFDTLAESEMSLPSSTVEFGGAILTETDEVPGGVDGLGVGAETVAAHPVRIAHSVAPAPIRTLRPLLHVVQRCRIPEAMTSV
jgi:hypothetical protein